MIRRELAARDETNGLAPDAAVRAIAAATRDRQCFERFALPRWF
jgi:hypothetical protein